MERFTDAVAILAVLTGLNPDYYWYISQTSQVAALFLPWSTANAAAIAAGDKSFETSLAGARWTQEPQKYHARSLAELRRNERVVAAYLG